LLKTAKGGLMYFLHFPPPSLSLLFEMRALMPGYGVIWGYVRFDSPFGPRSSSPCLPLNTHHAISVKDVTVRRLFTCFLPQFPPHIPIAQSQTPLKISNPSIDSGRSAGRATRDKSDTTFIFKVLHFFKLRLITYLIYFLKNYYIFYYDLVYYLKFLK
jgi:hypothetical protein